MVNTKELIYYGNNCSLDICIIRSMTIVFIENAKLVSHTSTKFKFLIKCHTIIHTICSRKPKVTIRCFYYYIWCKFVNSG